MNPESFGQRLARNGAEVVASVSQHVQNALGSNSLGQSIRSPQERLAELDRFSERYEELVETLCDSAQYGPTPKLETRYQAHRDWVTLAYQYVRPFLAAYLQEDSDDDQYGINLVGRPVDAFEALVASPDLDTFLKVDDGGMISRITRTRGALNLYGDHLRQLVVRTS